MNGLSPASIPHRETGLNPEEIDRTLVELWRELEDANEGATQVRMLNLLVYLPTSPSIEVRTAISAVALQHPGRTITMLQDEGPPHAEATIACRVGGPSTGSDRQPCGEQIVLYGSIKGHPLHSLALSLLQAGLPVTLWWHGPVDFDDHVFQQFVTVADRVVLDSRTWTNPLSLLPRLLQTVETSLPHLRFTDLQWVALTQWRRLIAHTFDVPAARKALPAIGEVLIEYGGAQRAHVGALLLAGWLMSRLGWSIEDGAPVDGTADFVVTLRHGADGGGRRIELTLRHRDAGEGIRAVQLRTTGEEEGRIALEVMLDDANVKTSLALPGTMPLTQFSRLHSGEPAQLLSEELGLATSDIVYSAALANAVQLAELYSI